MKKSNTARRNFVKQTITAAGLFTLPSLLHAGSGKPPDKKKVVIVGGHPDDPECGAGGTIPLLVKAGHEVTLMYFTNGDEGVEGKSQQEAAAIRQQECIEACKLLNCKPLFVNQVDGESIINNAELTRFQKLLWDEKPDVVFTHWPVDAHKDHQLAGVLTMQSWMESPAPFTLYFYEVCTGYQSFLFHPTDYVDISDTQQIKWKALACHKSQGIINEQGVYTQMMHDCGHPAMEDFRGKELGVRAAEAFIRMNGRLNGKMNLTFPKI